METIYQRHRKILLASEAPTPPITSNFDMNMVIILAALLCALICALGLNSIVRCALRCTRRIVSPGAPQEAAPARGVMVSRKGLKRSVLRRIPVVVYGDAAGVKVMATECTICLGEFVDGEEVRVLPKCNHGYHVKCIDTWLATHSSCPTCRRSLAEAGGGGAAVAAAAVVVVAGVGAVEHGDVGVGVGDVEGG